MSDDQPTRGPRPEPRIEPAEPNPGGVDARDDSDGVDPDQADDMVGRDLDPDQNPAVEDALPDEMKKTEDTGTKATRGDEDEGDTENSSGTGSDEAPA